MVNVPPIPPLLCSTPPPIDFGEEDEDIDVMPPTLDGVDDEEFGDFLTVEDDDNCKNDEPLPSPRPSSVSDLPPVSIYDNGLIPPDEDLTNHNTTPPPMNDKINKENPNNTTKAINIAEAFNYNIKTNSHEEAKTQENNKESLFLETNVSTSETKKDEKEIQILSDFKNESTKLGTSKDDENLVETKNVNKNLKDLRIETSIQENEFTSDKTNMSSIQNMVSIEDIEDDLSEDELYSPKTPKNFTEPEDIKDYFTIQEIKEENQTVKKIGKSKESSTESDTKSINSLDNNESSSVENENEFKSFSSNSFPQNTFDLPPPLDDQPNSIDDDDDFGDFADFQDFNTAITPPETQVNVDNLVPVNDKQLEEDNLEVNDFKDFINHNSQKQTGDDNTKKFEILDENVSQDFNGFKQTEEFKTSLDDHDDDDEEFDDFTSHTLTTEQFENDNLKRFNNNTIDKVEVVQSSEKDINNKIDSSISQENLNDSFVDFNDALVINNNLKAVDKDFDDSNDPSLKKENNLEVENSFGDFKGPSLLAEDSSNIDDNFGDFNSTLENEELPITQCPDNSENLDAKSSVFKENHTNVSNNLEESANDDDDEFSDFADFEQHQDISKTEQEVFTTQNPTVISNDDDDFEDDDDFGDFNTAQPITPTAPTIAPSNTSQNISTAAATTTMLTPKNLNERISKILQLMFTPPISNTDENNAEPKPQKIQDIPFTSIDAAKALEYQWLNSDTRHSFIKSLGIDSKNILYGENWNPSLPRFAANLSFNPLKPMKPVSSSGTMADSCSILEPVSVKTTTEPNKTLSMNSSNSIKKENSDIDWKSGNITEKTNEAFKDNVITSEVSQPAQSSSSTVTATSLPYVSNEKRTETPSLTIFESPLDNEEKFSKTPPISEMESVTTFPSPLPTSTLAMDIPAAAQIINNLNDFDLNEIEENLKNNLNINEVVVTSTFTGSFKETHIYTPSNEYETNRTNTAATSVTSSSPSKAAPPIDFDYAKAAMGVIIDETVVKKEYRDVEYNPPFTMESLNKSVANKPEMFEANIFVPNSNNINGNDTTKMSVDTTPLEEDESNDDFTEFQSVPSEAPTPIPVVSITHTKPKQSMNNAVEISKPTAAPVATVSHGGMILSPAILIPQAIFMENNKPKIEWGDSTTNINAEEMARIEELFPEPKSIKSSNTSNSSQKSTPTHQVASTPSISATVANKEFGGHHGGGVGHNDDDDWSDFVSVSITNNTSSNRITANNNILSKSPAASGSPFKQRSPVVTQRLAAISTNNSNNDDEWSDFVSSAPPPTQPIAQSQPSYRVPQFNSGAWQNANFYNNPLSMYHKGPINIASAQQSPKHLYNNNNNNNNYNMQQQQYQTANNIPPTSGVSHQHQLQHPTPQQIHIMQNFSTAPVPTPERLTTSATKNNQFQVGSAKVAPSIALIPDLGFVAPAIPTHTSFINSLPKPSINTKK